MPQVKALLIDMDGTLVDSTAVVEQAWARFAERHGLDLADILAWSHGRPTVDTVQHFLPDPCLVARETADLERQEEQVTDGVVEVPGAADFVRGLDLPWAVVTSAGRRLAQVRMAAAGVPIPPVLVCSEDVTRGKPDPEPYLVGAHRLGVAPQDCLVLEDSPAGVRSALASGARVVVVGALTEQGGAADATAAGTVLARVPDLRGVTLGQLLGHR